jgi:hypothetical protein
MIMELSLGRAQVGGKWVAACDAGGDGSKADKPGSGQPLYQSSYA